MIEDPEFYFDQIVSIPHNYKGKRVIPNDISFDVNGAYIVLEGGMKVEFMEFQSSAVPIGIEMSAQSPRNNPQENFSQNESPEGFVPKGGFREVMSEVGRGGGSPQGNGGDFLAQDSLIVQKYEKPEDDVSVFLSKLKESSFEMGSFQIVLQSKILTKTMFDVIANQLNMEGSSEKSIDYMIENFFDLEFIKGEIRKKLLEHYAS